MHRCMRSIDICWLRRRSVRNARRSLFEFVDRPEDRQTVESILTGAGVIASLPWIAINSSARWETKRWPLQHFAEAADQLSQAHALPIVFIGGPAERQESQAVMALMRTKAVDLTGQTL